MLIFLSIWSVIVTGVFLDNTQAMQICSFNQLCTCRKMHHEVNCRGVPFTFIPSLRNMENAYQVTIIRSGLRILKEHTFLGTNVASLHLMQNNLQLISHDSFRGLEDLLTTLDMSNNELLEIPIDALRQLRQLRWLNLNSNELKSVHPSKWGQLNSKSSLHSLFLGGNHITSLPDAAFLKLTGLSVLDLDGNMIHDIGTRPFPPSLVTLTLSNNLLKEVPLYALYPLKNLRWLRFSGNLLKSLPKPFVLQANELEKMDCSNNLLKTLSRGVFNDSFVVQELNLGFNFLRTLPPQAFKGTRVERLFLDNNKLSSMHSDAFSGVEHTLKFLDMSYNLLEKISIALSTLNSLLHLSLRGNLLKHLNPNDLYGCRNSLEVLDLSANKLQQIPRKTLQSFDHLVRISLQDNQIEKVYRDDFRGWGESLRTLSLANNKMTYLSGSTFQHTPLLRELKMSFNHLMYLDRNVFSPVVNSLEVLELSSAFSQSNHPPEYFVRDLHKIEWLQLDHNNISTLSPSSFHSLNRLLHLDMEGNELNDLPEGFFNSSTLSRMSTIHLSNNALSTIRCRTFDGLRQLSSVVLFNNKISSIETNAFVDCPYLHTLVLSSNSINSIKSSAFHNLSRLTNLFLEQNSLETFTLDSLSGVSGYLYLNLSSNILTMLDIYSEANVTDFEPIKIRILDLTNNKFSTVPFDFLDATSKSLIHVLLTQNNIVNVSLPYLPRLQVLDLGNNVIETLEETFSECCPAVQILSLHRNNLRHIAKNALRNMFSLRILDLSLNDIHLLTEHAFSGLKLESLNLSYNRLVTPPVDGYISLRNSLRLLDLSGNFIETLPASSFKALENLQALNLSSNPISSMHERCFVGLEHLMELDLSYIATFYDTAEDALKPLKFLLSLYLRNASLVTAPILHLPRLQLVDMSQNSIANLTRSAFHHVHKLRHLHLSENSIQDVPSQLWGIFPDLVTLDLSHNQINVLGVGSFTGLPRLRHLAIHGLPLKRLDPRAFHPARFLTSLCTDSYATVRSFRLQDLLSHSPAMRQVSMSVEESTLSHQLQGAFGTKLRELTITGENLRRILPDAFAGLSTHELTLRIAGTSVTDFPDGLLRYLPDIRYLTLDLRNNRLSKMRPEVLAVVNNDGCDVDQTQHITGGVLLEDNPWNCSCELLWLGRWLKRWLRETFQVHLLSVEAALYVNVISRKATCTIPNTNITRPIVDLRIEDVRCEKTTNAGYSLTPYFWTSLIAAVTMVTLAV